jgi:hypothetical protein
LLEGFGLSGAKIKRIGHLELHVLSIPRAIGFMASIN